MSVLAKLQSDRDANNWGHPSDRLLQHCGQIGRQPPMEIMGYRKNISELGLSKGGGVRSNYIDGGLISDKPRPHDTLA